MLCFYKLKLKLHLFKLLWIVVESVVDLLRQLLYNKSNKLSLSYSTLVNNWKRRFKQAMQILILLTNTNWNHASLWSIICTTIYFTRPLVTTQCFRCNQLYKNNKNLLYKIAGLHLNILCHCHWVRTTVIALLIVVPVNDLLCDGSGY